MSYIKFPIVIQHRPINVHLNNICARLVTLIDCFLWRYLLWFLWRYLLFLWELFLCIRLRYLWLFLSDPFNNVVKFIYFVNNSNSSTLIRILSWLHNPYIPGFLPFLHSFFFLYFFFFLNLYSSLIIIIQKFLILGVLQSFLYVECQRNIIEYILSNQMVVFAKVVE